jgi:hypothetical protein
VEKKVLIGACLKDKRDKKTCFLIKKEGEIIELKKIRKRMSDIIVRYESEAPNYERTNEQIYSIYALILCLQKEYKIKEINKYDNCGFDVISETKNIDKLYILEYNANKEIENIRLEINHYKKNCEEIIKNKEIITKQDVENSHFARGYYYGIKKINNIIEKHISMRDELIDVSLGNEIEIKNLRTIPIFLLFKIIEISDKFNYDFKEFLICSFMESSCGHYFENNALLKIDNKFYSHPLFIFSCWKAMKKTYPASYTLKIIKKYKDKTSLNQTELLEYLLAYRLLYEESKTIKDFDIENMWKTIYEEFCNGTYNSGNIYKRGKYTINLYNLKSFLYYNTIEI